MSNKLAQRVVLLSNGELPDSAYARSQIMSDDMIIAANGGTRLAYEMNLVPDLLVGDSDSLPDYLHEWLKANHVPHHQHPAEKDETDLELALRHAIALGASSVLFLGLTGTRTDHMLANFSLLALAHEARLQAEVVVDHEHLYLVYDQLQLMGEIGQTVSLLPLGGDAHEVYTQGLKWELHGETLPFGPARGISNIMTSPIARITLSDGLLIVCHQRGEID